ncbi:hypothetical protein [uncultured Celeribacter sp.]|uniref:hypothetical protein n=1 Tax=uncultured Celeribacter sp. TaxID=1303376 RepID=UPI002AA606B0|nr:hypothetical protein [uncultured Celeribacter sp.]
MTKPTTGGRYTRNKKTGAISLDVDHTPSALAAQQTQEAAAADAQVEPTTDTAEADTSAKKES